MDMLNILPRTWSIEKDDELKKCNLGGDYNNFYQFAFDKPILAGHAFWYYIAENTNPKTLLIFYTSQDCTKI